MWNEKKKDYEILEFLAHTQKYNEIIDLGLKLSP